MSYVRSRALARRRRRTITRSPLSGFFDEVWAGLTGGPSAAVNVALQPTLCSAQADMDAQPLGQQADDLAANWSPTGFYAPDDVLALVSSHTQALGQGYGALEQAAGTGATLDQQDLLSTATSGLDQVGKQALDFIAAAQQAKSQGMYVNAPGLKQWAVDSVRATQGAVRAASYMSCSESWWQSTLVTIGGAVSAFVAACKAIGGVVATLAQKAGSVVAGAFDLVTWIETYGPWVAAGLAAVYLYSSGTLKRKRSSG